MEKTVIEKVRWIECGRRSSLYTGHRIPIEWGTSFLSEDLFMVKPGLIPGNILLLEILDLV